MILIRAALAAWSAGLRAAADVIDPPKPAPVVRTPPPPVIPEMGDQAERWLRSLRPHHGPDETCLYLDCVICWTKADTEEAGA